MVATTVAMWLLTAAGDVNDGGWNTSSTRDVITEMPKNSSVKPQLSFYRVSIAAYFISCHFVFCIFYGFAVAV